MRNLTQRFLSTGLSALVAGVSSYPLDRWLLEKHAVLGASLAIYGAFEKVLGDLWTARSSRTDLAESLKLFFGNFGRGERTPPLWSDLSRQISLVIAIESRASTRELLRNALAEVQALQSQTSFIALTERQLTSLRRLSEKLNGV